MKIGKRKLSIQKRISQNLSQCRRSLKKSRSFQSIETTSQRRTIESKCNYKLSTQHIHFLMQQQRLKQINTIQHRPALKEYYQCFINIFSIIYRASKMVLTYMYYNKTNQLNVDRLQVLNVLLGNFDDNWNQEKLKKLQILSTNLYQMSKEEKDFQKRIEYVGRKLCNNHQKKDKIQRAFLNEKIKKNWGQIVKNKQFFEKNLFISDMFSSFAEKLCFFDIRVFVNKFLVTLQFKEKIAKYCAKHEVDEDLSLDYTFEFLLLQQFSFQEEQFEQIVQNNEEIKDKNESLQQKGSCILM